MLLLLHLEDLSFFLELIKITNLRWESLGFRRSFYNLYSAIDLCANLFIKLPGPFLANLLVLPSLLAPLDLLVNLVHLVDVVGLIEDFGVEELQRGLVKRVLWKVF